VVEVKALGGKGYYMERQGCEFFFFLSVFFIWVVSLIGEPGRILVCLLWIFC